MKLGIPITHRKERTKARLVTLEEKSTGVGTVLQSVWDGVPAL